MAAKKVRTGGSGGKHTARWGRRAEVKYSARKRRRREDSRAEQGLAAAESTHEAEARKALREVEHLLHFAKRDAACSEQLRTVGLALAAAGRAAAEAEGSGNSGLRAVANKASRMALAKLNAAVGRCACERPGMSGLRRRRRRK